MPTIEQYSNRITARLVGDITDTATSLAVVSSTGAPTSGQFRAIVGSEYLLVTAVSGTTWTIVRGQEGSTAAPHFNNDPVTLIVTVDSLLALVRESHNGTNIGARRELNFIDDGVTWTIVDDPTNNKIDISGVASGGGGVTLDTGANKPSPGTSGKVFIPSDGLLAQVDNGTIYKGFALGPLMKIPPIISSWTWLNQNGATATDIPGGGIYLYGGPLGSDNLRCLVQSVSAPFTLTAGFLCTPFVVNYTRTGLIVRDSVGGKIVQYCLNSAGITITNYTNTTTFSADAFNLAIVSTNAIIWFRVHDDGTNRTYQFSIDGINWIVLLSQTTTTWLGTAPNQVGICVNTNNATYPSLMTLVSWEIT